MLNYVCECFKMPTCINNYQINMQNFAKLFLNLSVISVGFEAFIHVLRCDLFLPYLLRYQIFSGLIADNGFFEKRGKLRTYSYSTVLIEDKNSVGSRSRNGRELIWGVYRFCCVLLFSSYI